MKKTSQGITLTIILSCILVALAQGTGFFYTSHYTKVLVLFCIFLCCVGALFYLKTAGRLNENTCVYLLILFGIFLRCSYVLLSGLCERQHDAGVYTGMGTDFVNPGHIGYIEYIYKFHKLPDINPYELFAYYHPPLHHIISAMWLRLNIFLGATEELAFANLQVVTLFYSCLCLPVTWKILKTLDISQKGLYIGLSFMVFHPATIVMAGSVNNDMLTILFMSLTILEALKWMQNKDLKGLIRLALCIGFGMITKLNSAVLAIPLALIFLLHLIGILRSKDKALIIRWLKNYCIFAVIVIPIGLSWIVRNLLLFGEKPGVPVPGETSPMYTAAFSLWERLGIPSLADWNFAFPFHPISAKACCNTWVIMFHTSLFAEEYPTDLPDVLLILCQFTFVLAVLLGVATAILLILVLCRMGRLTRTVAASALDRLPEADTVTPSGADQHKKAEREISLFLLIGYLVMLISFAAFVIIYPYTCSSDFRYVAICLVYIAIALGLGNKYYLQQPDTTVRFLKFKQVSMQLINAGIILVLSFITVIYTFWERW